MGNNTSSPTTGASEAPNEIERPHGAVTVEVVSGHSMPNMDVGSLSDCYVTLAWTAAGAERPLHGVSLSTLVRRDSLEPVWREVYSFPFVPHDTDILSLKVHDHDILSADDFIGTARVQYSDLKDAETATLDLEMATQARGKDGVAQLTVRFVAEAPSFAAGKVTKTFYFIRHGQSRWNKAKAQHNMKGLVDRVKQCDHALSLEGIQQAADLRARWSGSEAAAEFASAGRVMSSPLTRAAQTALVALKGHQAMSYHGLTLLRNLREVKNLGGLDTIGAASGPDIMDRVEKNLAMEVSATEVAEIVSEATVHPHDAVSNWWTPFGKTDGPNAVAARQRAMWEHLRYTDADVMILVGHSHFFRDLLRRHLAPGYRRKRPQWTEALSEHKLANAGCLRVRVRWPEHTAQSAMRAPSIVRAELVFGSKLTNGVTDEMYPPTTPNIGDICVVQSSLDSFGSMTGKEPCVVHESRDGWMGEIEGAGREVVPAKEDKPPTHCLFSPSVLLLLFTWMNFLNYVDRGIVQGAPLEFSTFIADSLGISPSQTSAYLGALTSAFIMSYAVSILVFGYLVAHCRPFLLVGVGLSCWCVAVAISGFAKVPSASPSSYALLVTGRIMSGLGEASFQCVAPPFIEDYASPKHRTLWLAIFYTMIPVGTAVGFEYGALVAGSIGWQWAYWLEGLLMLPFAIFCFFIPLRLKKGADPDANPDPDPVPMRQQPEDALSYDSSLSEHLLPGKADDVGDVNVKVRQEARCEPCRQVTCNATFLINACGYAGYNATFAGLSAFGSMFMISFGYMATEAEASLVFGATVAAAGIVGTLVGGVVVDRWTVGDDKMAAASRTQVVFMWPAYVLVLAAVAIPSKYVFVALLFISLSCAFASTPATTWVTMGSVHPRYRAFAVGACSLIIHAFGDVPSPVVIGALKDLLAPGCDSVDCPPHSNASEALLKACNTTHVRHSILNPDCGSSANQHGLRVCIIVACAWLITTCSLYSINMCRILLCASRPQLDKVN